MGRDGTCSVVQSTPPTRAVSVVAGEVGPGAVDVIGGLRTSGSPQWSLPELPERLERSFADRREKWVFWVHSKTPEVGGDVYCPLDQLEDAGELLEA